MKPIKPAPFDRAREALEQEAWANRVTCPACHGMPRRAVHCTMCKGLGVVDASEQLRGYPAFLPRSVKDKS